MKKKDVGNYWIEVTRDDGTKYYYTRSWKSVVAEHILIGIASIIGGTLLVLLLIILRSFRFIWPF